jgi:hypothetical protein
VCPFKQYKESKDGQIPIYPRKKYKRKKGRKLTVVSAFAIKDKRGWRMRIMGGHPTRLNPVFLRVLQPGSNRLVTCDIQKAKAWFSSSGLKTCKTL